MKTYKISWQFNGTEKHVLRRAYNACNAVERVCAQFGWFCRVRQYDADTHGKAWAEYSVSAYGSAYHNVIMAAESV